MSTSRYIDTITLGDSYKLIKELDDKSVDLVIIDPPYNLMKKQKNISYSGAGAFGKKGRTYHSELENNNIITGINNDLLKELVRVMKKINIYIWCNKEQILDYLTFFKEYNMELLTWHKSNPVPTCSNKYLSDTEYLLFFREEGVKIYGSYETKKKYYITDTNKIDKSKFNHPTIKPIDIISNLIVNSSTRGGVVLDAFMGSGTTAVACKNTERHYIGFEIDPKWCKIANDRVNGIDANGQQSFILF